jgi:hypothetical protein
LHQRHHWGYANFISMANRGCICLIVLMSYITEKPRSHPFESNKTY